MSLFLWPFGKATDANGVPVPGAKLFFYQTQTLVLADVYADATLTTPLTNPVQADISGSFPPIFLDPSVAYNIHLTKADLTPIDQVDPYSGPGAYVADTPSDLIASTGQYGEGAILETANGFRYEVADPSSSDYHVITAGGVKLYVIDAYITPDALGSPVDGVGDDAPFVERAFQINPSVHLRTTSLYRLASMVGIPDQTLYAASSYYLNCNGAKIAINSPLVGGLPEAIFTSAAAKANPGSTANLYTGKLFFENGNWTQEVTSVIFNGDRLYQIMIRGNSFDGIDTVMKSFRAKTGGFPEGYIQSVSFVDNQFSECRRIIDAKRGYDVVITDNRMSSCAGGVYIDSTTADPAVSVLRYSDNLSQGGGLPLVVGKVIGGTISGLYSESNTAGDAPTALCDIWFKAGPSPSLGVVIKGCEFQPTAGQIADAGYVSIRIDSNPTSIGIISVESCFTLGSRLVTPNRCLMTACGSNTSTMIRNSLTASPADFAKRSTTSATVTYLASTNLSGGVYRFAAIDVQFLKSMLSQQQRPVTGELSVMMQHRTAGGVVDGTSLATVGFVIMAASEGIGAGTAVDDVYATFFLKEFAQIPAGSTLDNPPTGAITRAHFASPVFSFDRTGDVYNLRLSNYSAPPNPGYGAADRITAHLTLQADSRNNSDLRGSPLAFGV